MHSYSQMQRENKSIWHVSSRRKRTCGSTVLNVIALAMVKDGRDGSYKSVDAKFGAGSLGIRLAPDMRIDGAGYWYRKGYEK